MGEDWDGDAMTTIRATEYKGGTEFVSTRRVDTDAPMEAVYSVIGCMAIQLAGSALRVTSINVDDNMRPIDIQLEVVGVAGYTRLEVL